MDRGLDQATSNRSRKVRMIGEGTKRKATRAGSRIASAAVLPSDLFQPIRSRVALRGTDPARTYSPTKAWASHAPATSQTTRRLPT